MEDKRSPYALAVKVNNTASSGTCAICGERTDPQSGPELFLADAWELVCQDCGRRYAPALVYMLEAFRTAAHYFTEEPDFQTGPAERPE